MPCSPAASNFVLDPLLELLRERFPFQKLDEQDHTLICALRDALPNGKAVDDSVGVVRSIRPETHVYNIIKFS